MLETGHTFTALSEEFVECVMRHDPVYATGAGIHDYDDRLPDHTPEGFATRAAWLRDLEQRLQASVVWEDLPPEQRVDYALLRSRIALQRAELEEIRRPAHDPVMYPETALRGVFYLVARPFAPLEERKELVIARLMAIPEYLDAARMNLERAPAERLRLASEVNGSGPLFVDDVVRSLIAKFPGEAERIEHAGSRGRQGFVRWQEFLDRDLARKVGGSVALGRRWYDVMLEREHMLEVDAAALEAFGRDAMARARAALEREAVRIDPARDWRTQVAELRTLAPEPRRVRDAYAAAMARARAFVGARGLAPLPEGPLEVVDTPVFWRPTLPATAYLPPAPFDVDPVGTFFVTPVDLARRPEDQRQQLAAHNLAALPLTAIHVAWPGHHLQLTRALGTGSRLRRLAESRVFAEGWALYAEGMMLAEGFPVDDGTRLWAALNALCSATALVADVMLHTEAIGFAEAIDFLVNEAAVERVTAEAEIGRQAQHPTEAIAGTVGRHAIESLRDEARQRLGAAFDLGAFHAALLGSGTVQPALLREELMPALGLA